ncbi:hypothetical protein Bbelb_405980 [Branchiostoma belcheri]|nr:hypothetical protein Bbelb_405980 [Branchiostoma belcheri]
MEEDDDTHQCRACKMVIQGLDNYVQHRKFTCARLTGKESQKDESKTCSIPVAKDGTSTSKPSEGVKDANEGNSDVFSEAFAATFMGRTGNEHNRASSSFQSPRVDKDDVENVESQPHDNSEESDKVETGSPGCPPMIMTVECVDDKVKDRHKKPSSQNYNKIPFLKPCTTRMGFSCKPCGVEFNNTFDIKKHLTSKQHLRKVGLVEEDAENSNGKWSEEVEGERPKSPPMAMTVDCVNDDLSSDDGGGFGPDNMEDDDILHDEDTPRATGSVSGVDDIEVQGTYCDVCQQEFEYKSKLKEHLRSKKHHRAAMERSDGYCEACKYDYGYPSRLKSHLESKKHLRVVGALATTGKSDGYCEVCQKDLMYKSKLEKHFCSKKHIQAASEETTNTSETSDKDMAVGEEGASEASNEFIDKGNHCTSAHEDVPQDTDSKTAQKDIGTRYKLREHPESGKHLKAANDGYCEVCQVDYKCKSQLDLHLGTKKHRKAVIGDPAKSGLGYCKVCQWDYKCKSKLEQHFLTERHIRAVIRKQSSTRKTASAPSKRRKGTGHEDDEGTTSAKSKTESNMQNVEDSATGNKGETQKEDRNFEEGDTETHVDLMSTVKYQITGRRQGILEEPPITQSLSKRHVAYTSEEHEEHCKTQDHAVLQEIYKHVKESQEGCIKYRCTICEYQSGNMEEIEIHVPKHLADDGKVFPCNYCNKLYPSRYRRQLHIEKLHTKTWKKTAICDVCGKCFYGSAELNMHMRLHQGIKPHKCTHKGCTYRAKVPSELKTHMMRHAGEKPFLCDRCSYASVTKQGLTRHVRHVHTKPADKLLKCEQCGYTTMQAHNLTRHITTHTGEKPFKCPHCPYRCNDDGNLRKHILKSGKHKGVKLYNCKSCDFGTNRVLDFFNHQRGTHGMAIVEDYKGSFMSGTTIDNMNPRFHRVSSSNQQQGPAGGTTDKQEGEVASAIAAIVPNDDIPDVESEEMASDNTQPSNAVGILEDLVEEMSASLHTKGEEQQEEEQQDTEMF